MLAEEIEVCNTTYKLELSREEIIALVAALMEVDPDMLVAKDDKLCDEMLVKLKRVAALV